MQQVSHAAARCEPIWCGALLIDRGVVCSDPAL
jgi:hypothetical protein